MNAAVLHEHNAAPEYGPFADPEPREGAVVVEVAAAGLHHLDLLCIPVDLTDLQPALVQTEAVLIPWRTLRQQAKARLADDEYQTMLAHELELERLQQGVLLQTLRALTLFRGDSHNLSNYLSLLGAQQGPLRDLIC